MRPGATILPDRGRGPAAVRFAWGLAARWISAVCLGLLICCCANADTWTNRAGHVLTARLVAIQGEHLILQHTNGRTWRLPLSSLKPADQQRAREQTGTEPLPSELRACLGQAEDDIQRAAQFLQNGKITRADYATRCQQIRQRFEHLARQALKDRGQQSDRAILDRLKQRLDPAILTPTRPDSTRLNPTNPIPNLTL